MKGLLAHRPPLNQLLTLVGVSLASFFVIGMVGTIVLQEITGVSLERLSNVSPETISSPGMLTFLRGMQFVQFLGLFVLPTWVCARLFSYHPNRLIGLQAPNLHAFWFWGILIMIISLPFIQFIGDLNQQIPFPGGLKEWMDEKEKSAESMVKSLLSAQSLKDLVLNIFFVAALAGIGEELLFRGLIQRLLSRRYGRWAGILIAAALFSAMHLQFYGFFPRFLLGIVLGVLFAYSGSLWVAILAHFFYDAMLITAAYANPALLHSESIIPITYMILPAILSLVLSVWVIRQMIWRSAEFPPEEPNYVSEDPNNPFAS